MTTYDYDIGILGGGAAGLTVAAGAAQFGAKAVLIEKSPWLGGDCLHFGCVPSKTLIRTAGVWALAARTREFGLPGLSLSAVDLGAVMERVRYQAKEPAPAMPPNGSSALPLSTPGPTAAAW